MASELTNPEGFLEFVKSVQGQTFRTLDQGRPYSVRVVPDGLEFTPHSTGRSRLMRNKWVPIIFREFVANGKSLHRSDYSNSVNASYWLPLLKRYFKL